MHHLTVLITAIPLNHQSARCALVRRPAAPKSNTPAAHGGVAGRLQAHTRLSPPPFPRRDGRSQATRLNPETYPFLLATITQILASERHLHVQIQIAFCRHRHCCSRPTWSLSAMTRPNRGPSLNHPSPDTGAGTLRSMPRNIWPKIMKTQLSHQRQLAITSSNQPRPGTWGLPLPASPRQN